MPAQDTSELKEKIVGKQIDKNRSR